MAGLVPAIHVFLAEVLQDVDARHKAGHDRVETLEQKQTVLQSFGGTGSPGG
jgi:hypothetical protein